MKNQDLMQFKYNQLEARGALANPKDHAIIVRRTSPCFIQQKGRAKHKPLEDCLLDHVICISYMNVLNQSIHPVPGRSNSYNKILKFMDRNKYMIFANLSVT